MGWNVTGLGTAPTRSTPRVLVPAGNAFPVAVFRNRNLAPETVRLLALAGRHLALFALGNLRSARLQFGMAGHTSDDGRSP